MHESLYPFICNPWPRRVPPRPALFLTLSSHPGKAPFLCFVSFPASLPPANALNQRGQRDHLHRSAAKDFALKEQHMKRSQETSLLVAFYSSASWEGWECDRRLVVTRRLAGGGADRSPGGCISATWLALRRPRQQRGTPHASLKAKLSGGDAVQGWNGNKGRSSSDRGPSSGTQRQVLGTPSPFCRDARQWQRKGLLLSCCCTKCDAYFRTLC